MIGLGTILALGATKKDIRSDASEGLNSAKGEIPI